MEDSAGSSPSCLFSSNREAADEIVPTKSAPAAAVIINGNGPPFHPSTRITQHAELSNCSYTSKYFSPIT